MAGKLKKKKKSTTLSNNIEITDWTFDRDQNNRFDFSSVKAGWLRPLLNMYQ